MSMKFLCSVLISISFSILMNTRVFNLSIFIHMDKKREICFATPCMSLRLKTVMNNKDKIVRCKHHRKKLGW